MVFRRRRIAGVYKKEMVMLERLLLPEKHAVAILMKDHDTVKELFDKFEKAQSASEKEKIIYQALTELKIHASIEEEIFYPSVRKHVGADIMNEADEEHHVARVLIAELDRDGHGNDHRNAKFTVLAESIRHHIREEESKMLPKAKSVEIDFAALGQKMLDRKAKLKADGIPKDAEHMMVGKAKGRGDSPAAVARRKSRPVGKASKVSRTRAATKSGGPRASR